jgi:guanylate kinase
METTSKKVLVLGGPTGGGKDTIVELLLKEHPQFVRLTTATTRKPRVYEQDGRDYYFLSNEQFKIAIETGEILEHTYFANRDEYYGTYKPDLERKISAGKIPIAVTDRVGAKYMKDHYGATTITVIPVPFESLHERFLSREPDATEEWIARRMENAKEEIELGKGNFDYTIENEYGKLGETLVAVDQILRKEGYIA